MKKIMILGGSNCQKNAVLHAKSLGYKTIIADYAKQPAVDFADEHIRVSTFDAKGCTDAARKVKADGVMTMGTDQPVLSAAIVARELSLPSPISVDQARALTNKKIMKTLFVENDIPVVSYRFISENSSAEDIDSLRAPLVLKPLDSQGQRGVFKIEERDGVFKHLKETLSFSREKEALLEEYYESDEIVVSGWVRDGRLCILLVTDRISLDDPMHIGICTSHRFPSIHMDKFDEIKKLSERVARCFNLKSGPLYIQMFAGREGILVNEAAARIGGAFEDVIIPKVCGFDILDAVMRLSLGMKPDDDVTLEFDCQASKAKASVQMMFANPGVIHSITELKELSSYPGFVEAGYNYKVSDEIKPIENATARFGHCVFFSESEPIAPSVERFKQNFKILDQNGKNLYMRVR